MDPTTKYILKEDKLQQEELTLLAAIPLAVITSIITILGIWLITYKYLQKNTKFNKKLTDRLKSILKDGKPWKVMVVKTKSSSNAFCIGTPLIFITSKFIEDNKDNPRMIEAVLLHEAGHVYNFDAYKRALVSIPVIGTIYTTAFIGAPDPVVASVALMVMIVMIASNIIQGQPSELRSDKFAARYGYSKELIEHFKQSKKEEDKLRSKVPKHLKLIYVGLEKMGDYINVHPSLEKRIKILLQNKNTYAIAKRSSNIKDLSLNLKRFIMAKK